MLSACLTWAVLEQTANPGTRLLDQGHTGADVFQLQWLRQLCGLAVPRNGIFAETTHTVLVAFQQRHQLWADGIVDSDSWQMLRGQSMASPAHRRKRNSAISRLTERKRQSQHP